ncbi:hypothetical protein ACFX2I_022095 [Malus domestica]
MAAVGATLSIISPNLPDAEGSFLLSSLAFAEMAYPSCPTRSPPATEPPCFKRLLAWATNNAVPAATAATFICSSHSSSESSSSICITMLLLLLIVILRDEIVASMKLTMR